MWLVPANLWSGHSYLENGLFTEALLEGLSKQVADENKEGAINTDERRSYVSQAVGTLGGDLQHPTIDRDNPLLKLSFSF